MRRVAQEGAEVRVAAVVCGRRRRRRFTALNEVFGGQILKVDGEQRLQGGGYGMEAKQKMYRVIFALGGPLEPQIYNTYCKVYFGNVATERGALFIP
ncbi:hypothetical protein V9T40_008969 [Parthenolecanium corni]|uniref:Uncharacterized protein n=1 Tax=Parthenolecanium corni TaxID=536013 RepID=A0AAN9TP33_9HEMI